MSQLQGSIKFDFSGGLFFHLVVLIRSQMHGGLKIVYDVGLPFGPRATVGLDENDGLYFEVTDVHRVSVRTPPVSPERYKRDKVMVLWCALEHDPHGESHLWIDWNGERVAETSMRGEWGGEIDAIASIGASILGTDPAAFQLAQLGINRAVPEPSDLKRLLAHSRSIFFEGTDVAEGA